MPVSNVSVQPIDLRRERKTFFSGFFAKGARIYLLLEGEVTLTLTRRQAAGDGVARRDLWRNGDHRRPAAQRDGHRAQACRVLSLDERQFQQSLQQMPEFALMLMSVMAQRLRRGIAKLATAAKRPSVEAAAA
jgi:hypothetical protein